MPEFIIISDKSIYLMAKGGSDQIKKESKKTKGQIEEIPPQREQKKKDTKSKDISKHVVATAIEEVHIPVQQTSKPKNIKDNKETKEEIKSKLIKSEVKKNESKTTQKQASLKKEVEVDSDIEESVDEETLLQKFEISLNLVKKNVKVNDTQIKQAVACLKTILNKMIESESNIFQRKENESVYVNFSFSGLPASFSVRPVILPVKIESTTKRKVCLIIKDPAQIWIGLNINFEDHPELDVMVIPLSELKLEYAMFEQKRNLLKQFDTFICDTTIYMHLKKTLGREFYDSKKYPINVKINSQIDPKKIKADIIDAASNYLFYMSKGPNYSVKAAFAVEKDTEIVKKVQAAIVHTLSHILKWDVELESLKSISLKLTNSIELPIFNNLTKEEIQIAKEVLKEGITPRTTKDITDRTKIDPTLKSKLLNKESNNHVKSDKPKKENKSKVTDKKNK